MIAPNPFFVDRGFSVLVYEQARALIERGVHVEVVSYHSGRDVEGFRIHRAARFPGYAEGRIGPSLTRLPLWVLLLIKTFLVARRTRPDLLHGHIHEGVLIAAIVSRLLGIPFVFDYQGSLSLEMSEKGFVRYESLPFRAIAFIEGFIDRLAPLVLVRSPMMEDDLTTRFGLDVKRVRKVMDGADPNSFAPRAADPVLRAGLGIAEHATVLGYLGLLSEQQGIGRMLRAFPDVLAEQPESHLLVIGYPVEGWDGMARGLGIAERVTFAGRVEYSMAADYLALADLTIAPKSSKTEGNAKVYNYMSMALPVVAIDSAGNRELLGDDGFYAACGEPAVLASTIVNALRHREEWEARGQRLRKRLIERFTWDAVGSRLIATYQEQSTAFAANR